MDLKWHVLPSSPKLLRVLGNCGACRNKSFKGSKKVEKILLHIHFHLLLVKQLKACSGIWHRSVINTNQRKGGFRHRSGPSPPVYIILVYTEYYTGHIQCMFWKRIVCSNVVNIATAGAPAWINIGNLAWYSSTLCHQNSLSLSYVCL